MAAEPNENTSYVIDFDALEKNGRSAAFIVRSRLCWLCRQAVDEEDDPVGKLEEHLERIRTDCAERPDYLLPGTPLTEAIFRILLAEDNRPMTIREIQDRLSSAWASVIYMKDLSADLLARMLDGQNEYMIRRAELAGSPPARNDPASGSPLRSRARPAYSGSPPCPGCRSPW